ncbi:MoaF-related domain-containing protein [Halomonas elongata]|uniref:MoaF-related domain-containing protein n=1 Tax=Halomonas elongata TaxID=2746 RepID=UPI0038D3A7F3
MAMDSLAPLTPGETFAIHFPAFTPRITVEPEGKLTVEIVAGDNAGFSDTVEYDVVVIREDVLMLSWQEHIGSTIVHVLDFGTETAHTAVTPAKGGVMRLTGRIAC